MESWKVIGIDGIMEGYRNSWNHRNISQQATCIPHTVSEKTWRDLNLNKKQGTFTKNVD